MDKLVISGLKLQTIIGVYAWEQAVKQTLLLDVVLQFDSQKPGQSDKIADSIDYAQLNQQIRDSIEQKSYRLIEAVAEDVASLCLAHQLIQAVEITVHKPGALRGATNVAISICRARH